MRFTILLGLFILANVFLVQKGLTQGDLCDQAINISNPRNYCSGDRAYNTADLNPSNYDAAHCFHGKNQDIWFKFTSVASDATITITGNTTYGAGGTIRRPEVSLYSGVCGGTLTSLRCETDNTRSNIVELRRGGLLPGQTYLIRVQSAEEEGGSFRLCLNNFNPPVSPGSDCKTAAILCDKSPFTVEKVIGAGDDPTELNDAECFYNAGQNRNYESSSTWFKFVCKESGTLEFSLTPLNRTDDIDFVLYELPNGLNDCSGKRVLRCMAAGEIPELYPSPCHGATGLAEGHDDIAEPAGCQYGNDNWLAPANLIAGKTYVLAVNNYSDTGQGFLVEWGGTAEFLGPEPDIVIELMDEGQCYTDKVVIHDASQNSTGEITSWAWHFGEAASPPTANGPGPHPVEYSKAGTKFIQLIVESDKGCISTFIDTLDLFCCDVEEFLYIGEDARIELGDKIYFDAEARLKGMDFQFTWMIDSTLTCYTCPDPIATPLEEITKYIVRVEDEYGCSATDEVTIYVNLNYPYYIPNAFTPNSDGLNDFFTIFSNDAAEEIVILEIFNRWGDKVFSKRNFSVNKESNGWNGMVNGMPVEDGVYFYRAIVQYIDGMRLNISGDITIIK